VNFVHVKRADGLPDQRVGVKQKVGLFLEWEVRFFGFPLVSSAAVFDLGHLGRPAERVNLPVPEKING
jgi:hypothetical protein